MAIRRFIIWMFLPLGLFVLLIVSASGGSGLAFSGDLARVEHFKKTREALVKLAFCQDSLLQRQLELAQKSTSPDQIAADLKVVRFQRLREQQLEKVRQLTARDESATAAAVQLFAEHFDAQAKVLQGFRAENDRLSSEKIWTDFELENLKSELERLEQEKRVLEIQLVARSSF